jgi:5-methylcytosine-specific restriction endonuclease McrA
MPNHHPHEERSHGDRPTRPAPDRPDRRSHVDRGRDRHERVFDKYANERLHRPVLVLNASYEPINVCAARRALVLVLKGIASAEEVTHHQVASSRNSLRLPSVIRLLEYRRIPHQSRALSRKNILMRDRYTCQYCQKIMPSGELTLDHVIPRSRAGETTWENLVACCHPCNNRKGSRTPEEAGMKLLRPPRPFSMHTSRHLMRLLGNSDDQWRKYLFY